MKSVIRIDDTWSIQDFERQFGKQAKKILDYNNLPNPNHPFDTLYKQQRVDIKDLDLPVVIDYDIEAHLDAIKSALSDPDLATAIAYMSPDDFVVYQVQGIINGYLRVEEEEVDDRDSLSSSTITEIRETYQIPKIREYLQPPANISIPHYPSRSFPDPTGWFWSPRGEVIFSVAGGGSMEIPAWPDSVKDTTSATWSQEMTTYQHYEPVQTYKGSGPRTVTASFKIHRAMWTGAQDTGSCDELVALIQSACYPDYGTQAANCPTCALTIGNSVAISGVLTNMDTTYQGPIGPDCKYDEVVITITIVEVASSVLDTHAVAGGLAGWR